MLAAAGNRKSRLRLLAGAPALALYVAHGHVRHGLDDQVAEPRDKHLEHLRQSVQLLAIDVVARERFVRGNDLEQAEVLHL